MSFRRQVLRNRTIGKDGLLLLWIIGRAVLALAAFAATTLSGEHLFRSSSRDAHDEVELALRPSRGAAPWLPRWFPTLLARLDYLLVRPEIVVVDLEDLDAVGPDHRPFRAELAIRV